MAVPLAHQRHPATSVCIPQHCILYCMTHRHSSGGVCSHTRSSTRGIPLSAQDQERTGWRLGHLPKQRRHPVHSCISGRDSQECFCSVQAITDCGVEGGGRRKVLATGFYFAPNRKPDLSADGGTTGCCGAQFDRQLMDILFAHTYGVFTTGLCAAVCPCLWVLTPT
jgi:hypothetical protein